ncbi:MAG: alkaline phosphatase [Saprospiraceae bacterium]|nr:alkaline phosphatase [Saprospiraceae bacterium]
MFYQRLLPLLWVCCAFVAQAQPVQYRTYHLHSHNDYQQAFPFWDAYNHGFGSMEADIFFIQNKILVAHEVSELDPKRDLATLYLDPLRACIEKYKGNLSADTSRNLQLMIDLKTEGTSTLPALVKLLNRYPDITGNRHVKILISGNKPPVSTFRDYPSFILFDGNLEDTYSPDIMPKIGMLSGNFAEYAQWNGKGVLTNSELHRLDSVIARAHAQGRRVRFWNAPDMVNAWHQFMRLKIDWINTDLIEPAGTFMETLTDRAYLPTEAPYACYTPAYRNDGGTGRVKNVILLIGDGMGLAHLYAAYTANRGALNVFNMRFSGLSKTSSFDSYITDSAPGSTAFSSGIKTRNRSVGVDANGQPLVLLPSILKQKGLKTGLVTSGDLSDATPADFYAHQSDRSNREAVVHDLQNAGIDIIMGSPPDVDRPLQDLLPAYTVVKQPSDVLDLKRQWVVSDPVAGKSVRDGRGIWLQTAFEKTLSLLATHPEGFFLMAEGAQIDYGGHANILPYVVTEVADFDQVVAKAMAFADQNGETLVIVTADHETGGLTLLDGDYKTGYVSGQFSTNDHTATPVPVFAYGPRAQLFTGVYENTAVFYKVLEALGLGK